MSDMHAVMHFYVELFWAFRNQKKVMWLDILWVQVGSNGVIGVWRKRLMPLNMAA
jgi:hypothetical protein